MGAGPAGRGRRPPFTNPGITRAVAAVRLDEGRATRADVLATACSICGDALSAPDPDGLAGRDVLEILAVAL